MRAAAAAFVLVLAVLALGRARADETIVVEARRLVPGVLTTVTGLRVNFVNHAGMPVHVEFGGGDVRQHELVQAPATGPVWAVFHRPGTHPYVVHVYDRGVRALAGVVDVVEDETHTWDSKTCGLIVMGECIER